MEKKLLIISLLTIPFSQVKTVDFNFKDPRFVGVAAAAVAGGMGYFAGKWKTENDAERLVAAKERDYKLLIEEEARDEEKKAKRAHEHILRLEQKYHVTLNRPTVSKEAIEENARELAQDPNKVILEFSAELNADIMAAHEDLRYLTLGERRILDKLQEVQRMKNQYFDQEFTSQASKQLEDLERQYQEKMNTLKLEHQQGKAQFTQKALEQLNELQESVAGFIAKYEEHTERVENSVTDKLRAYGWIGMKEDVERVRGLMLDLFASQKALAQQLELIEKRQLSLKDDASQESAELNKEIDLLKEMVEHIEKSMQELSGRLNQAEAA